MCTVTYIPSGNTVFITSNRDEKSWRTPALAPSVYEFGSGKVMYPKDGDAGGTWFAVHENGNVVVFLNGGLVLHQPSPPYRKSRGLILLDLIDHPTPFNCFLAVNLNNIEPFTAIIRDNKFLFECRWDGERKYTLELDSEAFHIWSSVTLYDPETIIKRKQWFTNWTAQNKEPNRNDILHFHQFTGDGDTSNDLLMNREGKVFTVSITSIEIKNEKMLMQYLDLKNNQSFSEELGFETSMASG